MYCLPSASKIAEPWPLAIKHGSVPTDPQALTGLFTPPGMVLHALANSSLDFSICESLLSGENKVSIVKNCYQSGV
jgi:hypothetical protein